MDTFKIKTILSVARNKSMSRTAEDFSYTPSALSHMISAFETELGVKIFDRVPRGVTLTAAGKELLPELKAMLDCERAIYEKASKLASKEYAEIRIATYSSLSRNFLPNIIKGFRKKYPDIKISVRVSDHIAALLEDGSADVIFGAVSVFGNNEWLELAEDEFLAVAPVGVLGDRHCITREELYSMPQIFTDDDLLRDYFDVNKFSELMYFRSEDDLSVINMVKNGIGVTVLPSLVLKENCDGVQVARLSPPLNRTLGVAFKRKRQSIGLKRFLEYIKETKEKILQEYLTEKSEG